MIPRFLIRLFPSSLRGRLIILGLLAALPALLLVVYNSYEQSLLALERARAETLRMVRLAGEEHDRIINTSRQLLMTLAQLREVRTLDASTCRTLFSELLEVYPDYANITAVLPSGQILAVGSTLTNQLNVTERPYFRKVTNTLDFVVGRYYFNAQTNKALLDLAYPVRTSQEQPDLAAVIILTLHLDWVFHLHARAKLPEGSSFTVIDQNRLTLARYPDPEGKFVGQLLRPSRSFEARPMQEEQVPIDWTKERAMIGTGRDGVRRIYGFSILGTEMGANSVLITMGIPVSAALGPSDKMLQRNLIFLGVVAGLALAAAWFGSDVFVLGRVRSLLRATEQLQAGDLSARINPESHRGELQQLAGAFDRMAERLEKQFGDRVRAEEALRRLNLELEERVTDRTRELKRSNEDLEQFAYVASHDLQEPLRMVTSYLNLLQKRYREKLDQDAQEFIGFAVDGAQRMHRLINDLLTYSRVQTRAQPFEQVDCNQVLERVLHNLKVTIEENGAQIAHEPLPTLPGDVSQLTQLFQNLLSNAIRFHGDQPPRVRLSARAQGTDWLFSVQDNGIGISQKHFERIFVIFQRLHGRDKYTGTGIGLAICKKIIERHGGRIWVESEPGQGSTFYFTLPKNQSAEAKSK